MRFQQIQPPDYLKRYIRYFWTLESNSGTAPASFKTIADGCPGLIFQQLEKGAFYRHDKALPGAFLYGQSTTYSELILKGTFCTIGIYFYPDALKSVFGFNAEDLTDSCVDLDPVAEKQGLYLSEQLSGTFSTAGKIEILSDYLFSRVRKNNTRQEEILPYAISQIIKSKGNLSIHCLLEKIQVSERSFERKFKQHVGISPKLFSRICRFQASLNQLRKNKHDKLSDIAFENDYADQSHFIRAFKEFTGLSPNQYQKESNEIVENFSELIN